MNFFLIFENPVYRKMFESYLWIVSIDYPETSWVQCVVFLRKHIRIWWIDDFFKLKNKKKLKKISKLEKNLKKCICKVKVSVAVCDPVVSQFREKCTLQPRRQGICFERAKKIQCFVVCLKIPLRKVNTLIKSMFSLLSCRTSQTEPFLNREAKTLWGVVFCCWIS